MRKFITLILLSFAICANSQSFSIGRIEFLPKDYSAVKKPILDNNLDTCALVKVSTTIPDVIFENNVVEYRKTSSTYWVYIAPNSRTFSIYHRLLTPLDVKISDYGLKRFEGGKTYVLTLTLPEELTRVLSMDSETKKLTRQRKKMIQRGLNYDKALAIYNSISRRIGKDNSVNDDLRTASELGLPKATESYYRRVLNESTYHLDILEEQRRQYSEYTNWFYENEIRPIDDKFDNKSYCQINIPLDGLSDYMKYVLCGLVDKFNYILSNKAEFGEYKRSGYNPHQPYSDNVPRVTNDGKVIYGLMKRINQHGNIDEMWFMKAKQIWGDLLNIAAKIPNSKITYTN